MRKLVAAVVVMVLAVACFQTSDPKVKEYETPDPNAADGVTVPADVTPWTPDDCMLDADCAGTAGVAPCQKAVCKTGECVVVDRVPGSACDDPALELEECQTGVCMAVEGKLACTVVPAVEGTPCGSFHPACGESAGCKDGACQTPCDDGNPCTDGECTPTGCLFTNNTSSCNDGNACSKNDACVDGICVGEVFCECKTDADCQHLDDNDICTGLYECKSNNKCGIKKSTVITCPATGNEPCQVNECNPFNGNCKVVEAGDGTECDDKLNCTEGDFCVDGACTGVGRVACEWLCDDELDDDTDELFDCDDPDCWGIGECPAPECGDEICQPEAGESCATCADDCGACPPECGDGIVQVETGEECDDGKKLNGDGCDEGCKVEPAAADPGDIIVTEIMKNPVAVDDEKGEWFEILNTTGAPVDINGWYIKDADPNQPDSHRILTIGGTIVPAGGYFVLGLNGDKLVNGGIEVDYVYEGVTLGNKGDELILLTGETVVDKVEYDDGITFPGKAGQSLSLVPGKLDHAANDLGANWCAGHLAYGPDDYGTPGQANPACPSCGDDECLALAGENCDSCPDDCGCEAGFACEGEKCVELNEKGEACATGNNCKSTFCVDLTCCDTQCAGVCFSCTLAGKKGTCSPVAEKTVCGVAECVAGKFYAADECNTLGTCIESVGVACAPYVCNAGATACLAKCLTTADCAAGNYCKVDACVAKLAATSPCTLDAECLSGKCGADNKCE